MKAEVNNKHKKYPYIGHSKITPGLVVLFYKENCGVVIQAVEGYYHKIYSEDWSEFNFDLFTGKIILEND